MRWPRLVKPYNTHYLVHKIVAAWIDKTGIPRFKFQHEDRTEYFGPCYLSSVNGKTPLAETILHKNGLEDINDIKYVVAYHWGAFPNGRPVILLSSLDDLEAKCSKIL
jgi:hypothetical protein